MHKLMAIFFLNENTKQTSSMESIVFSQSLEISISIYYPIQIIYAVFCVSSAAASCYMSNQIQSQ